MLRTHTSGPEGRLPGQGSTGARSPRALRRLFRRDPSGADGRFSLVFVCTGNRFRSPLAAALVRRLTPDLPVDVASVGTINRDGVPPLPEAYTVAAGWGLDLSGHRSRALTPAGVAAADLVLGFEQMHVRHAVVDGAVAQSRAFTLGEFLRLLDELSGPVDGATMVERARLRVAAVHAARGAAPGRLDADELGDPFGRKRKVFGTVANEVRRLSLELVTGLFEVDRAMTVSIGER